MLQVFITEVSSHLKLPVSDFQDEPHTQPANLEGEQINTIYAFGVLAQQQLLKISILNLKWGIVCLEVYMILCIKGHLAFT